MKQRSRSGPTSWKVRPQHAHKSRWQSVYRQRGEKGGERDTLGDRHQKQNTARGGPKSKQNVLKRLNWSGIWQIPHTDTHTLSLHLFLPVSHYAEPRGSRHDLPKALFLFGFVNRISSGLHHQIWNRNCSLISLETQRPIHTARSIMQPVFQWAHHKLCFLYAPPPTPNPHPKLKQEGLPQPRTCLRLKCDVLKSSSGACSTLLALVIPGKNGKFSSSDLSIRL